uniref:Uncharacterized protein n=1 Tax=Timema douglasi TaxID=61478 RepID=A0A7R8ZCP7_TIMDO|nr:unnamed protein product [Timema douglasi]
MTRLCSLLLNVARFSAWLVFTEIALHLVYSNSLVQHPKVVAEMGSWSLYGLGYCMGQFFMLKYVVMYGLMGTIAQAENINAPRHPKCIARISLYSDMWRYFDEGLYRFLLRGIRKGMSTRKWRGEFPELSRMTTSARRRPLSTTQGSHSSLHLRQSHV